MTLGGFGKTDIWRGNGFAYAVNRETATLYHKMESCGFLGRGSTE